MSATREWSTLAAPVYAPPTPVEPEPRPAIFVTASRGGWHAVAYTLAGEPVASAWARTCDGARFACDSYVDSYLARGTR